MTTPAERRVVVTPEWTDELRALYFARPDPPPLPDPLPRRAFKSGWATIRTIVSRPKVGATIATDESGSPKKTRRGFWRGFTVFYDNRAVDASKYKLNEFEVLRTLSLLLEINQKYEAMQPSRRAQWWLDRFGVSVETYKTIVTLPEMGPSMFAMQLHDDVCRLGPADYCITNPYREIFTVLFRTRAGWKYMGSCVITAFRRAVTYTLLASSWIVLGLRL
jgi:hypothetical protein